MSKFVQYLRCPNGFSLCFVIATLLLVCILLYWQATSQYHQFVQHQLQLSKQSATGASNEISAYVDHLRHQVKIFSQDRLDALRQLAISPEDSERLEKLNHDAAAYFPNYFAITIADSQGIPILGNYDQLVNELCQADIIEFAQSRFNYDIFMHPHPEVQHFDVMTPVELDTNDDANRNEVFFISFKPTVIQRFLGNAQIFGHSLYLLKNDIDGLIELTAQGTRVDLIKQNKNHILPRTDLERVDYIIPVHGTRWNLASIADENLYSQEKEKIIWRAIYVFFVFATISLVYLALLNRLENKRQQSDSKLKQVKEQLQHTLNFSNVGTWNYDSNKELFEWSDDAQSILICPPPITMQDYLATTSPEDRQNVENFFADCITTGQAITLEHRITSPDGATHWMELAGSIDKEERSGAHILGLIRDVTIRKLAEQTRLQHEKQQRDTLIREVHHRIKNNLQGVINLLLRHSKQGDLSQTILKHAISQLNSVSLIHGLSGEINNGRIYLSELIPAIVHAANNFTGSDIHAELSSSSQDLCIHNEDNAVAIALIINELVFNAIKHSEAGTTPEIMLDSTEDMATLTIINRAKQITTKFDYDRKIGLGSGLKLVNSLLPKNGARFSISRTNMDMRAQLSLFEPVITAYHDTNNAEKQIA